MLTFTPRFNAYLFGCVLLMVIWLAVLLFLSARRLHGELRELWWASGVCSLLGLSEPLFVPEYWNPPTILRFRHWDLESFLFCFAVGGIAAVAGDIAPPRRLFFAVDYWLWRGWRRLKRGLEGLFEPGGEGSDRSRAAFSEVRLSKPELRRENMLLVALFLGVFGTTAQFNLNIIYDAAITCVGAAFFIAWRTPRLKWDIATGGLTFLILYTIVILAVGRFDRHFFDFWNWGALSGRRLFGAPVEEYLYAGTFGMFWGPFYEAWKNERAAPAG